MTRYSRRYYVDPMTYEIDCGDNPSKDTAVAALMAAARMVRPSIVELIIAVVITSFFLSIFLTVFSAIVFSGVFPGGGIIGIIFIIVPLFILATAVRRYSRLSKASNILREMARMVMAGMLDPSKICGMSIAAAVEYYNMMQAGPHAPLAMQG